MADYSLLNDPDMAEIFESFIVETKETLEKLDLDLIKLESKPEDTDLLNEIFRSFHTVKGTSGFLGLVKMQALTHRLEDILNKLRKGESILNSKIMDAILKGYDTLGELLEIVENDKNEDFETKDLIAELQYILDKMEYPHSVSISDCKNENIIDDKTDKLNNKEEIESEKKEMMSYDATFDFDEEEIQKAFIENNKKLNSPRQGLPITTDQAVVDGEISVIDDATNQDGEVTQKDYHICD